ncbi:hypothetical protein RSAG8_03753, partial [Rhizoctonia solani AG-8 WAC10335]
MSSKLHPALLVAYYQLLGTESHILKPSNPKAQIEQSTTQHVTVSRVIQSLVSSPVQTASYFKASETA